MTAPAQQRHHSLLVTPISLSTRQHKSWCITRRPFLADWAITGLKSDLDQVTQVRSEPIGHSHLVIASTGSIFRAYNVYDNTCVALKVQHVDHECPTNLYEEAIYPLLQGGEGMPRLWANGTHGDWHYLVISLLGKSLESIYREHLQCGHQTMDLRSVCSIAIQVVS